VSCGHRARAEGDLGVGIDEGLLVYAANTLQIADIEGVLRAAIAGMLAFELAERMFIIRDKRS
jgi:hypothetical protein